MFGRGGYIYKGVNKPINEHILYSFTMLMTMARQQIYPTYRRSCSTIS